MLWKLPALRWIMSSFYACMYFHQNKISFEYDLERIIDDWVLMGFLVGNDFIPHLPHLHINHDALPLLYRTYISVLPSLGGESVQPITAHVTLLWYCNTEIVLIIVVSIRLPEWKRSSQPYKLWEVPREVVRGECFGIVFTKCRCIISNAHPVLFS